MCCGAMAQKARKAKRPAARQPKVEVVEEDPRLEEMRQSTQKIMFIDSVVVDKGEILSVLNKTNDIGTIANLGKLFPGDGDADSYVFVNEMGNRCYFSKQESAQYELFSSDLIGNQWTNIQQVTGICDSTELTEKNYPFMMSDGITLYFAAQGDESIGGWDIFVTRYDSDDNTYLKAENIGMPFNSTANDYMYALDEVHNLGWFVSDRFQPTGKVCVYIFIPNEVREVYNVADTGEDKLRRLARATSIAETWHNASALQAARDRLAEARSHKQTQQRLKDFDFIINDRTTYSLIGDFKSPTARKLIIDWKIGLENWKKGNEQLQTLRDAYATGNDGQKKRMSTQILTMEKAQEALTTRLKEMEKTIRNEENAFLNKHIR